MNNIPPNTNLSDIYKQYTEELNSVNQYIENVFSLFRALITTHSKIIKDNIPLLFDTNTQDSLQKNYTAIQQALILKINCINKELDESNPSLSNYIPSISYMDPTPEGDFLLYVLQEINKGITDKKELIIKAEEKLEVLCITKGELFGGEYFYELHDNPSKLDEIIDIALKQKQFDEYNNKKIVRIILEKIKESHVLFCINNLSNVWRLGFIQIMSYFDGCIFKLISHLFKSDFLSWIGKFESTNIKSADLSQYKSFEDFINSCVEDKLKKCYVKDLIAILYNDNRNVFISEETDFFPRINEMICRRNIHIHNNGIVDQQYLDKFNIHKYSLGDFVPIDYQYLQEAFKLTLLVINNVVSTFDDENSKARVK